jgi:hypothetical protein
MLIAVLGKKRSGKDTFSDYIINKYGFIKYSFADPLKKGIQCFFNLTDEQLNNQELKETIDPRWGVSPRRLFQVIGTDIFQHSIKKFIPELEIESRKHWVVLFKQWYEQYKDEFRENEKEENENEEKEKDKEIKVIISDGRFLHEIEEIKKLGGKVIKIIRPISNDNDIHQSENEIDTIPDTFIDYTIINDGLLNDFYNKIDDFILLL